MKVKFGNTVKDVPLLEVTAANYICPKGEEGTYHCRIEQTQFNAQTGKRLSRPRIQKFEPKMWPTLSRNLKQQGWTIDILHDPTEYLAQQAAMAEQTEAERIKAQKEREAARKEAEKAALKAEIIAELKEAGIIPAEEKKANKEEQKKGSSKK